MFREWQDVDAMLVEEGKRSLALLGRIRARDLGQVPTPGARTVGVLAAHLADSLVSIAAQMGLELGMRAMRCSAPGACGSPGALLDRYARTHEALRQALRLRGSSWLRGCDDVYGERWERGKTLMILFLHEAHHRGQLSYALRSCGVALPATYGPSAHER